MFKWRNSSQRENDDKTTNDAAQNSETCGGEGAFSFSERILPQTKSSLKREITFKIAVVGDFGVGKTSVVNRYSQGIYSKAYSTTIGADFAIKTVQYDENTKLILQLWDVAGNERFGCFTGLYYRYAVGAIIVFDLTRLNTFQSVEKWLADIRKKVILPNGKDIPVVLLGNKADIPFSEHIKDLRDYCKKNNILDAFHVSAKNNVNLDLAMGTLIDDMVKNHVEKHEDSIRLTEVPQAATTNTCCYA